MPDAASRLPDVLVIGGGFAGLAAATALGEAGARVLVVEARPHLGGRARSWTDPASGAVVDNGQHLFMGCYRETLRFLDRVGTRDRLDLASALDVRFVERGGRMHAFRIPPLPGRLGALAGGLRYGALRWRDRLRLGRVATEVRRRSRPPHGGAADLERRSVGDWLAALGQSAEARERLWDPLAIAALNETPDRASAAILLPVLRAALLEGPRQAALGVPRVGLSDLYALPAARFLRERGGEVRLRAPARGLLFENERCTGAVLGDGTRLHAGCVICTGAPRDLLEILPARVAADPLFSATARLEDSPIVSVYLWFGNPITDLPFAGLIGATWQWLFNRRAFAGRGGAHGVTLVRSAARDLVERAPDALVRSALAETRAFFPAAAGATLRRSLVIKERHASFSAAPGTAALRPGHGTPYRGLLLAGDWTATGLPATIEGAVVSGHACAALAAAPGAARVP